MVTKSIKKYKILVQTSFDKKKRYRWKENLGQTRLKLKVFSLERLLTLDFLVHPRILKGEG